MASPVDDCSSSNLNGTLLELSIGGKHFTVIKETLVKYEGSLFHDIFVKGTLTVPLDAHNRHFIDHKPKFFKKVYGYLRDNKLTNSIDVLRSLVNEAKFYKLTQMEEDVCAKIKAKEDRQGAKAKEEAAKLASRATTASTNAKQAAKVKPVDVRFLVDPSEEQFADMLSARWELLGESLTKDGARLVTFKRSKKISTSSLKV